MFSRLPAVALLICATAGCGVGSVAGGTKGKLLADSVPLGDVQVTVHQINQGSTEPIGFAVTAPDGSFELVTNGAQGPLWLSAGEYRCTLESVGAPVLLPKQYLDADTTPLKVVWSETDSSLELKIPTPRPLR